MSASPPSRACRRCGCTDTDCRGCVERTGTRCVWVEADLCSACTELTLPEALTPAIGEVLGLMSFETGSIASAFRAAGCSIPYEAAAEQAFVLWRFLPLAILHGEAWRKFAADDLVAQRIKIAARQRTKGARGFSQGAVGAVSPAKPNEVP